MGRPKRSQELLNHPLLKGLMKATKLKPAVSAKSLDTYHGKLHRLEELTGKPLVEAILDVPGSARVISKAYMDSATTRKGISSAVLSLFSHNTAFAEKHVTANNDWKLVHQSFSGVEKKVRENNKITPAQRARMTSIASMQAAARKLKPKVKTEEQSQAYVLLRMMTEVPPKRLDLGDLLVCHATPAKYTGNYVLVPRSGSTGKLVLQQYKTFKTFGVITDELPASLTNDLRASLKAYPRKYVFERKGLPMTPEQYGNYIKQVCLEYTGKASSMNDIRHAYISEKCLPNKLTYGELSSIARSMGHNPETQAKYHVVGW